MNNLLNKFNEECAEAIKEACKTLLYGPDSVNPDLPAENQITNIRALEEEISDIFAAVLDLAENKIVDYANIVNLLESKKGRREQYKNFQLPSFDSDSYFGLVEQNGDEGESFGLYFKYSLNTLQRLSNIVARLHSFECSDCSYFIDGPYNSKELYLIEEGASNDYMSRVTICKDPDNLLDKIEELLSKQWWFNAQIYKLNLACYKDKDDYSGEHLDLRQ